MKIILLTFTILLLAVSCDLKTSEYYNSEAEKLEKEGKYEEAIVLLDKAIEKDPKNIYALLNRAVDKSMLEDYEGAISDYTKVLEIDSDNTLAYFNRGNNKQRLDDYNGAIIDYNAAIETKGGEGLYIESANNPYSENYEFDVLMEEIKLGRGIALYNIDSLTRAFDDFNFCIQKNYYLSISYYHRGAIYIAYDMLDEGCKDLHNSMNFGDPDAKELIEEYCQQNN
jgi:tetratricopeptide (TPR) repeat protein